MRNAPSLKPTQFTAMMRLDHNRAVGQIAQKIGKPLASIRKVTIWGNHSATKYPDVSQAECGAKKVWPMINDMDWLEKTFIPTVQKRGAAIIEARGLSSAASAANAAMDHVRDWVQGTRPGNWVSMGVPSDGSYGIPQGVIYGYPVTCESGKYKIVKGIPVSDFSRARMDATLKELHEERVSKEEMADRIKAAVDAKADTDFIVMARTDALAVEGLDPAIERALACVEAGADAVFPEAMTELSMYRKFAEAVKVPVLANITEFGATPLFTLDELRSARVAIALYPLSAFRAMNAAALKVYNAIRKEGTQKGVLDSMQTRADLYDTLDYLAYERKLDQLFAKEKSK